MFYFQFVNFVVGIFKEIASYKQSGRNKMEQVVHDDEKMKFWMSLVDRISWKTKPSKVYDKSDDGLYHWFPDGILNTSYLALDFHVESGKGEEIAIIYDSPVTKSKSKITYRELLESVEKMAFTLDSLGVRKGDTVVIYMPMIPEALVSMLACARIGAVHSVVFGGFAPHELAVRLDDCRPKIVITASYGVEISKIIPYKPLLDEAMHLSSHKPDHVILKSRPNLEVIMHTGRDFDWDDLMETAGKKKAVNVSAGDPLYILYTSGTTGKPKGVVRDNGGHAIAMHYSMEVIYDMKPGEVFFAASDVGWVVGHSYIVYAPLIYGCTTVLYEGKPVRTPDAGAFYRIIEEYKVKTLFCAPTAFRAIRKEDPDGKELSKYNISSLKYLFLAGERTDPVTYDWACELLKVPVVDHWWQTETGWAIAANMMGASPVPTKAGSATKPVNGFDVRILDEEGHELGQGEKGNIVIKLPLPPGCLPTLWNDHQNFEVSYLSHYPGYYLTGDGGYFDEDGYLFILGRIDDVINVAGHRLSTGEMEEIVAENSSIAESAVIGIADEIKGQVPLAIVVCKDGITIDQKSIEFDITHRIREKIGAIASLKAVVFVKRLPKTRSGKILRKTMRKMIDGETFSVPSTIDDPSILDEVMDVVRIKFPKSSM
ncbi:acetate--CoA ligase [Leptospira meyeri]|nr:acetate--CoA ligase [Leptospira meyeri]